MNTAANKFHQIAVHLRETGSMRDPSRVGRHVQVTPTASPGERGSLTVKRRGNR
ncbi:MAG: hypothetical protein M1134_00680 [Actinobacteria bacterium]|nr:hypothetical protein [Actinomycetota bacterium]MCL5445052.1 hypothetical protein [Actinomycetota bacterium]